MHIASNALEASISELFTRAVVIIRPDIVVKRSLAGCLAFNIRYTCAYCAVLNPPRSTNTIFASRIRLT